MRSSQIRSNNPYASAVNNKVVEAKEYNELQADLVDISNTYVPYIGATGSLDLGENPIITNGIHAKGSDDIFGTTMPLTTGITIFYDTLMGLDGMIFCYDFATMIAHPLTIVADTLEFDADVLGFDMADGDLTILSEGYGGKFEHVGDARTGFQCNSKRYGGTQFGMGVNAGGGLIAHHLTIRTPGTGYTTDDILSIEQAVGDGGEVNVTGVDVDGGVTSISFMSAGTGYIIANDNATANIVGAGVDCTIDITEVTISGYVFLQSNNGGLGGITYPIQIFIDAAKEYEFSATALDLGANNLTTTGTLASRSLTLGYGGVSGSLILYSEQGATDRTATLSPNASMTSDAVFYLPADEPGATYLLNMTSGGVIGFDTSVYINNSGNQTIGGTKTFSSFPITPTAMPDADYEVANKAYVDSVAVGLIPHLSVRVVTIAALPACTYTGTPNFTLTGNADGVLPDQDGITLVNTDRILVKNQATTKDNGIYVVTAIGDAGNEFVLTRADDFNTTAEVDNGAFFYVREGDTMAGYQYVQTTVNPTLDTDPLIFAILYAPRAETLDTVTDASATTTNSITVGGITSTGSIHESGIKNLTNADSPYTVLSTDRHLYCKTVGGAIIINLPIATGSGRILSIHKRDDSTNTITVHADHSGVQNTINGENTSILSVIYSALKIQDGAANEWADIIGSTQVRLNSYNISSVNGAFKTLQEAVTWFNSSATTNTEFTLTAESHLVTDTIVVDNPTYDLMIRGMGSAVTTLEASTGLTGKPMFNFKSNCDIRTLTCDGSTLVDYGDVADADECCFLFDTTPKIYSEITDLVINSFTTGISDIIGVDFFLFNFIISNCDTGVEINYTTDPGGTTITDIEIGNFEHCLTGINLASSFLKDNFYLAHLVFKQVNTTDIAIKYTGGVYLYGEIANIFNCTYNDKGEFLSGFDWTNSRDSSIEVVGNVGEEDKTPHAKINVTNNALTTTILTANIYYKASFVNTYSYTSKMTLTNNKMLYQSKNKRDGIMWLSGALSVSGNNKTLDVCIRKDLVVTSIVGNAGTVTVTTPNVHYLEPGYRVQILGCATATHNGTHVILTTPTTKTFTYAAIGNATSLVGTCGVLLSPMTVRTGNSGVVAPFSLNTYIDDIAQNDFCEIYITSTNGGDVITIHDINWLFSSR